MSFIKKSKNSGYILLGGGLLALGLGTVAYVLNKGQKKEEQAEVVVLDRNTVIKILKELRKEMFTVFTNFSMVSMQIKQQTMGKARPEEVKAMLLEQPMFRSEIESVEDGVYDNFGVSKAHFQHIVETQFGADQEVRAIQQDMKDSFDKSFSGIPPDSKVEIPVFLTPSLCFEILEKVMIESAIKLNQKLLEFKESGEEVNFNNPKLIWIRQSKEQKFIFLLRKEILADYGLDKYEESPQKILQYATQQYQMSNIDNFGDKMKILDMKYQQMMEQLLSQGPMNEIQLRKLMQSEAPQSAPFAGMGGFRRGPQQQQVQQTIVEVEVVEQVIINGILSLKFEVIDIQKELQDADTKNTITGQSAEQTDSFEQQDRNESEKKENLNREHESDKQVHNEHGQQEDGKQKDQAHDQQNVIQDQPI